MFSFACSDGGQSLRDDTIFMLAGYNNLSSGPDSYSYSIGLNTETKEGFFNLHIMGQDSESSLDIVLGAISMISILPLGSAKAFVKLMGRK